MINTRYLGSHYEKIACKYLERQGLKILENNYRYNGCEIDIIASYGNIIIFFEVKYRKDLLYGHPLECISQNKIYRIKRAAFGYLYTKNFYDYIVRFDCISIIGSKIDWIMDAF